MSTHYLSAEEILVLHSEIIDETGGLHGVRDIGLLGSIIEKPKTSFSGKELYKGIFVKAAIYLESIVNYHVFLDGNKRTSFVACARFLFKNGQNFSASNKAIEDFVLRVALEKPGIDLIAGWLKKHSKKLKG